MKNTTTLFLLVGVLLLPLLWVRCGEGGVPPDETPVQGPYTSEDMCCHRQ